MEPGRLGGKSTWDVAAFWIFFFLFPRITAVGSCWFRHTVVDMSWRILIPDRMVWGRSPPCVRMASHTLSVKIGSGSQGVAILVNLRDPERLFVLPLGNERGAILESLYGSKFQVRKGQNGFETCSRLRDRFSKSRRIIIDQLSYVHGWNECMMGKRSMISVKPSTIR